MCREKEAAVDRQDFGAAAALRDQEKQLLAARAGRDTEWAEAAAGRMPLAQELGQVKAELDRLRAFCASMASTGKRRRIGSMRRRARLLQRACVPA